MNKRLIITRGLPASGKTTWSREWVNIDPKRRIRVNRDDIRRMLGPYWVPQREDLVTDIEDEIVETALNNDYSVVVDATNFRTDKWKKLAINEGVELEIEDFTDVPVEECIRRDSLRPVEEQVGEKVIQDFHKKYLSKN